MKKIIILTLLITNNVFTQDSNNPVFNGIGILKVNITNISVVKELETLLNTQTKKINSIDNEMKLYSMVDNIEKSGSNEKYGFIINLSEDTLNPSNKPIYASSCKNAKVFVIGGYSISGIILKGLRLTFFNDTLIEIHCDGTTELTDAIKLKYGRGKLTGDSKEINCIYKYNGNTIKYKEEDIKETWNNGDIEAYVRTSKYYNDNCKEKFLFYMEISSLKKTLEKYKCEEEIKKNRKIKEETEKLKNLKDF